MNKTIKRFLILSFLIIILILYLLNCSLIMKSIVEYTKLFMNKLFPASFIFFTISSLLIDYGLIELLASKFKLNTASFYVFLMSLISGFPSGCKYTKELLEKGLLSDLEANSIIMSTHFPNPLFVLGTISLVLDSKVLALKIYLALIGSNLIIYLFTRTKKSKLNFNYKEVDNFASCLTKSINKSLKVIILIYGSSLFFYLIACIITKYIILDTYSYVFINGVFDLTKGIVCLTLINNSYVKCMFTILFLSLGGISIHMQVKSIIADTKLKYKNFVLGRIIGTILAIGIFLLIRKS